jgi:glycosyltransferase involved in cell wall biosynthesis
LLPPTTDDPGTPAIIGYIGEIHQTKGSIDMLEILKRVRKDMPRVRMLLIGNFASDTERSLFENHATELGLSEAIEVKGYREHSHALQLLRSCTVCIHAYKPLPWLYYNQVLKIGEYMAISKAIVSWDYPGVRRMLNEGGAGILVPPGNLNSMAQNVVRLITDKELRKRLEKSAFDHARKYLVWSRIGEDVFGALKDLLEKDQCPQCHAHRCRPQ